MSILRNYEFAKEFFKIKMMEIHEYRANLYLGLLANIGFMITLYISYLILHINFDTVFYWNIKEFIFFSIFLELSLFPFGIWFRSLNKFLLRGELNSLLVKPVSPFINYAIKDVHFFGFYIALLYLVLLIIYLVFFIQIYPLRLLFSILLAITGGLLFMVITCAIDSLSFFIKWNKPYKSTFFNLQRMYSQFPASFFKQGIIRTMSFFIPATYSTSYVTDFYFSYISYEELLFLFMILICLIAILALISCFLWKSGLRKYEAFG